MQLSYQVAGLRELASKLAELGPKHQISAFRKAGKMAAEPVLNVARSRIPVSDMKKYENGRKNYKGITIYPGHAKRSIAAKVWVQRTGHVMATLIGIRKSAFYAINFVELGTSKQAAQPWLRPAFDASHKQMIAIVSDVLNEYIHKVAKRRARIAARWHRMIARTGGP